MLTGHTEANNVIEARDAGITEFLAKPISVTSLYKRICSIIEHPRTFIHCETFDGPDRRRREGDNFHGDERRHMTDDLPSEDVSISLSS